VNIDYILPDVGTKTKPSAIKRILDHASTTAHIKRSDSIVKKVLAGDQKNQTIIGESIVIFHVVASQLEKTSILIGNSPTGFSIKTANGNSARAIVILLTNFKQPHKYIPLIGMCGYYFSNTSLFTSAIAVNEPEQLIQRIVDYEDKVMNPINKLLGELLTIQILYYQMELFSHNQILSKKDQKYFNTSLLPKMNRTVTGIINTMPLPIQDTVNRLHQHYGPSIVNPMENSACTGCFTYQPVSLFRDRREPEDVPRCSSCGRFLYL